jgi:large exoprotein involved in heme utilization and adhesion
MKINSNKSALIALLSLLMTSPSNAQMTPDLTLPNNSNIKIDGNIKTIDGGTQVGNSLFHSLRDFSVTTP